MRVSPVVPVVFLIGIFINSVGRLLLSPLHYPIGLKFTTIGYMLWAATYLYIAVYALFTKRFNLHLAFWLVFTILAPIQFNAARHHQTGLNSVTSVILITQLVAGSVWEAYYYYQRRAKNLRDR